MVFDPCWVHFVAETFDIVVCDTIEFLVHGDFLVHIWYVITITDIFCQLRGSWGLVSEFPFAPEGMLGTSSP